MSSRRVIRYRSLADRERTMYLCDEHAATHPGGVVAEPWVDRPVTRALRLGHKALSGRFTARFEGAAMSVQRRIALGLPIEALAELTRRTVDEYTVLEAGDSLDLHQSDQFVMSSALAYFEAEARADLDGWTRDHPDADRAALVDAHPTPVLMPRWWGV